MARGIGNFIAPPRFILFALATAAAAWATVPQLGIRFGLMAGFDAGALLFLLICLPLLRHESRDMRVSACRNDANRVLLLLITGAVMLVILIAIASILMQRGDHHPRMLALVVGTLALSWVFSNTIYALHYAHMFYTEASDGSDSGGFEFPGTKEPDYWDFIYFAFCLGMTFQTSDVTVTDGRARRTVTLHCLEAFVFNLGVIAFTINVLGAA